MRFAGLEQLPDKEVPQLLEVVARGIRDGTGTEVYPIFAYRLGRPDGLDVDQHEDKWGSTAVSVSWRRRSSSPSRPVRST